MSAAERLKADRALPVNANRSRKLHIVSNENDDHSERPTQPDTQRPPSDPSHTLMPEIPPAAGLPRPDPNSFSEQAMQAILDGMAELKLARKAFDADALLSRQTEVFASIVSDRYEMIRGPIVAFGEKLDALVKRVGKVENQLEYVGDRLESGDERFERIELELASIKTQMGRIEQMRAHIDNLEIELASLRKRDTDVTAQAAAAPTEQTTTGDP